MSALKEPVEAVRSSALSITLAEEVWETLSKLSTKRAGPGRTADIWFRQLFAKAAEAGDEVKSQFVLFLGQNFEHFLSGTDALPGSDRVDRGPFELLRTIDSMLPEARARHSKQTIEKLVDALIDTHDPLAHVSREIDLSNARARMRFVEEIPTLTSEMISEAAGHKATNRSQTASRWKADRKLFSVPWQGQERYPAFQFRDGKPLPVMASVLAALPDRLSPWEIAFWFVSTNSFLNGAAPYERLDDGPDIISAAERLASEVVG
jgi:hypothetical protein